MVKKYGLENEKLAGNKQMPQQPLVLDDRLISKQYIKDKVDGKVDDTAYDASWDAVTDVAPSKNAVLTKQVNIQLDTLILHQILLGKN